MKKLLILLALPVTILYSCKPGSSEAEQKTELENHVMAVHDSAMAEMDQIFKLRRNLNALHDTLAAQQTDSATLQLLQQNINALNNADEHMMGWMRNYSAPDSLQHQQAMEYLQQELQKIERVKTTMDSTIQAARQTYQQHEPTN
ncbi:hypothetical protein [Pontibacter fetidus]|uniref:Viral A-type inclusion protein n=1 Tax=Pontibacter fetidus TaxID=2700082 RepID=A0A6B2GWX0_9BACT|nr:hypothetical protein [Pontibacter fetidus]NDK55325.1 hypothetical protein [Pontibacter fetidus]